MPADRVQDLVDFLRDHRLAMLVAVVALPAAHWLWFHALPYVVLNHAGPAERQRRQRYLEWVVATPSLLGRSWKVLPRIHLIQGHLTNGRHEQVVAVARDLLAGRLPIGLQATTRTQLADSLEALGDPSAAEERLRARDCLKGEGDDASTALARGNQLKRQGRHAEAFEEFARGLERTSSPSELRSVLLAHMSLAAFACGRMEDSADLAARAIAQGPSRNILRLMHRQAANALGALGRLEESVLHRVKGLEIARSQGDPKHLSESLADLASLDRRRGRLADALRACDEAIVACPDDARHAHTVRYEILKAQGRFAEAMASLDLARRSPPLPIPHHERQSQATFAMGAAWIALDLGNLDEARAHRLRADPALTGDPKLRLWLLAFDARLAALSGDHAAYADLADRLETEVEAFAADPSLTKTVRTSLGKAAVEIADFEYGEDCWGRFLDLDLDPVQRIMALYYSGLCHDGLGRPDAARDAYCQALALEIDTHHARLASARLGGRMRS